MVVQSLVPDANNTVDAPGTDFGQWINRLSNQLSRCHQRRLVSCEGSRQWSLHLFQKHLSKLEDSIFLSDQSIFEISTPLSKIETLLGTEHRYVIVDIFEGLNPDVICITAGLVKCGGILLLLSPGPEAWKEIEDRFGIWQNQRISPDLEFVQYFFDAMNQDTESCIRIRAGRNLSEPGNLPALQPTEFFNGKTIEQADVLEQINNWLSDDDKDTALLTADRGRGKSACLGFAITEMVENRRYSVILTAYSRQSAGIVFSHCQSVDFIAPDRLISGSQSADVLVIDEAAMLPMSMLKSLSGRFKKVLMATTVGGYEGTGSGFLLRFVENLDQEKLIRLKLDKPVRWAENDYLENWINRTFMMAGTLAESAANPVDVSALQFESVNRRTDITSLQKVYRLMTAAHYRTRPSDLRALMENPDLSLTVATNQSDLTGVLVANCEGGFDRQLSEQVFMGKRRPKGHLLAQMLTAQAGLRDFASYAGLRVQRIAVDAVNRRRGIGKQLIKQCEAEVMARQLDYIGACFAIDADAAAFWKSCGFKLVHVSYGQGKSTGNHSVAVIKTFNSELRAFIKQLQCRLVRSLPVMMVQGLQHMTAMDVISVLRLLPFKDELQTLERDDIEGFANGNRGFGLCFPSLQRFVMQRLSESPIEQQFHPWLVEKVIQHRQDNELTPIKGCSGRKAVQKKLRGLVAELVA